MKILRNITFIVGIVILSFAVGFQTANSRKPNSDFSRQVTAVSNKTVSQDKSVDFSLFWDVWERVSRQYFDKKAVDPAKMVYGAISGMVASLGDPYTVFLLPEQNKEVKDNLGGTFEGIGAQLGVKDKKIIIASPLKGSPAEAAGLKSGDWIVKVDDKETFNWTLPEAVSKIRGPKGTKVVLNVMSKDEEKPKDFTLTRDAISVSSVEWEVKKVKNSQGEISLAKDCENCDSIIYLKLSRFGDQTTDEWNKAIDEILKFTKTNNPKGLVFDLRNNPGGYLSGSVFIASEFIDKGLVVIQESLGGKHNYEVNRKGRLLSIPMVVLINKGSASASEIVAGALRDHNRGRLAGETSFGKGTIQDAQELSKGAGIHITTSKWLTPSGKWINGTGLEPDIKVEAADEILGKDNQLEKAIEKLYK